MKSLAILGIVGAIILVGVMYVVGAFNEGNSSEQQIVATWDNMQNILGQFTTKVAEAAQVPAMQRNDLTKVVQAALSARYGKDGSKATFQWIQEQNPQINSAVYVQIQQIIEAGRNQFQNEQTRLIDSERVYKTALGSFPKGFIMHAVGYPKIDLAKYKPIVSTHAKQSFETGIDDGVKLPGAN